MLVPWQIPFGYMLLPHLLSRLPSKHASGLHAAATRQFSTNSQKLHTQLLAYTLTNQITGAFLEVGLPYLKNKFMPVIQEKLHQHEKQKSEENVEKFDDAPEEKPFLDRIRQEQMMPVYANP